jgi:hypothetical protein
MVRVNVDCIRMSLMTQLRVVILKDMDAERYLAIWIGPFEAEAIAAELQEQTPKRPLTHDLMKSIISDMGGEVTRIVVSELRRPEDIFYAKICIEIGGREIEVDARPSDAIALAVRARVPIFVEDEVMDVASVIPEEDIEHELEQPEAEATDDKLSLFKDFVESLDLDTLDDEAKNS